MPRHPPYALCSLIGSFDMIFLHLKYTSRYTRRSVSSLAFLANCRMSSEFAFRFSFLRSFSQFSSVCSFQGALWWRWSDLNRRPPACKAGALPAELHPHVTISAFAHTGFRPRLSHAYLSAGVVGSSGLEPPTSRLSGVRSNLLSYEPVSFQAFPLFQSPLSKTLKTI